MKVKPLGDRILIVVKVSEEKTAGGLVIPTTSQVKTQQAVVIDVGNESSIGVKKGDTIIYDKYAGTQIKIDDKEHIIIKDDDIIATVTL